MIATKKTPIRKFGGLIAGYLEEDNIGNQQVRSFSGKIIAKYDKLSNVTRDFYGRIISKGNTCLAALSNPMLNKEVRL